MEDLVELVGELEDRVRSVAAHVPCGERRTWMVGGGFPASKLDSVLGRWKGARVSAWLIERMGHLPKVNEVYVEGDTIS